METPCLPREIAETEVNIWETSPEGWLRVCFAGPNSEKGGEADQSAADNLGKRMGLARRVNPVIACRISFQGVVRMAECTHVQCPIVRKHLDVAAMYCRENPVRAEFGEGGGRTRSRRPRVQRSCSAVRGGSFVPRGLCTRIDRRCH